MTEQIIPLLSAVVTVMAKWLYSQPIAITLLLSMSKIRAFLRESITVRHTDPVEGRLDV